MLTARYSTISWLPIIGHWQTLTIKTEDQGYSTRKSNINQ